MAKGFQDPVGNGNVTIAQDKDGFYAVRVFLKKDLDDGNATGLRHLGVDWNADGGNDANELAYATYAGTIAYVSKNAGSNRGGVVMINHTLPDGSKYTTVYMHLEHIPTAILNGTQKTVSQGELLGDSGFVTAGWGLHIHYEVREGHQTGLAGVGFGYVGGDTHASITGQSTYANGVQWADIARDGTTIRYLEPLSFTKAFRTLSDPPAPTTKPDLVIQNASLDDTSVARGDTINVSWEVKNSGAGSAGTSTAGVYLSTDATWSSNDLRVGDDATSSLTKGSIDKGEGDSFVISKTLTLGTWYVLVVADDGKKIAEANENNNVWSQKITVASAGDPDLVIQNVSVDDKTIKPGQKVEVEWDVKNIGTGEADESDTFIYLSKDQKLDGSDKYLDHETLGVMSPKEIDGESESFTMLTGIAKGRWYLAVVADAKFDIHESNESNNIAWIPIDII